MKDIPWK